MLFGVTQDEGYCWQDAKEGSNTSKEGVTHCRRQATDAVLDIVHDVYSTEVLKSLTSVIVTSLLRPVTRLIPFDEVAIVTSQSIFSKYVATYRLYHYCPNWYSSLSLQNAKQHLPSVLSTYPPWPTPGRLASRVPFKVVGVAKSVDWFVALLPRTVVINPRGRQSNPCWVSRPLRRPHISQEQHT